MSKDLIDNIVVRPNFFLIKGYWVLSDEARLDPQVLAYVGP